MRSKTTFAVAGLLTLATVTAADAAVISTPALTGIEGGGFSCHVVNVSGARQRVKITMPGVVDDGDFTDLLPNDTTGLSTGSHYDGTIAFCQVVTPGSKDALRVTFESRSGIFPQGQATAVVAGQ